MVLQSNALSLLSAVAFAVSFSALYNPPGTLQPAALLQAMEKAAGSPSHGLRVALGANVCVDLIASAAAVLTSTGAVSPGDRAGVLETLSDVLAVFLHHHAAGAAGERSVAPAVFEPLVSAARTSPDARESLGGNAALMARRLAALGASTILGGHIGPGAAALLPPSVQRASPLAPSDEVHLILEYPAGSAFPGAGGTQSAPRANRFILTADVANTDVQALAATVAAADAGGAHALVVSGLHMLEPLPSPAREEALERVAAVLSSRRGSYPVHLELASMSHPAFASLVAARLFPVVASLGFNEQEAAFLYAALEGPVSGEGVPADAGGALAGVRSLSDVTGSVPRVASVASVLRFLLERHPSLSRLHFHALGYHVTAYRAGAGAVGEEGQGPWKGGAGAVAAGSLAATLQACSLPSADAARDADLFVPLGERAGVAVGDPRHGSPAAATLRPTLAAPVATWSWALSGAAGEAGTAGGADRVTFALAPVAACRKPRSTVGLGDAVSASGLGADVRVAAA